MDRKSLAALWEELFGKSASPTMKREVLIPILAYRLQENAYGALRPSVARQLRAIVEDESNGGSQFICTKAGTRMVREWNGKLHEVTVAADGYEYNNRIYRSLSEIARYITGTRWSGPAFFGLKKRDPKRAA
jgi:hypothetical protein